MSATKYQPHFKVFLVDDSLIVIERLYLMLNEMERVAVTGHATNISSALDLVEEQKPDAVILDVYLEDDAPHTNGMYLLAMLRKIYPDLVIIMLTNMSEQQYQHKCMALGANYFFDKTNDFDKIPGIIQNLLYKLS